ncbi:MAG: hypothetical protein ACRDA3_15165 [Peptostreptococcaceae bacterium]
MNKKASKIVLFTTMGLMIMSAIVLGFNIKENNGLEDISGNKDALNNVNIIYQKKQGAYRTKEVKLSKDETKVNEFAKARDIQLPFTNNYKDQRDFYSESYSRAKYNYEYEDTIGFLNTEVTYISTENIKVEFLAREKNLKTNKVNEYKMEISEKNSKQKYSSWKGMPIRYNGELYALVIWESESVDSVYSAKKESSINIYKLDLQNEKAEIIDSKEFKTKDEYIQLGYPSFTHNNKYYIAKDTYKIEYGQTKVTRSFITYDLKTSKFDSIDMTKEIVAGQYYSVNNIEGNTVNICSFNERFKERILSISTLNLEDYEFTKENEIYNIDVPEEGYNYSLRDSKSIDGKIYAVINAFERSDLDEAREQFDKNYVYVIDEKSKEILYIGLIKEEYNKIVNIDIVLDEEI